MKKVYSSPSGKTAIIEQTTVGYSVDFFIDGKIMHKTMLQSIVEAEECADNFIGGGDPTFLSESFSKHD